LAILRLKNSEFCPGVKRIGCGLDHKTPYTAEVKERVKLHHYSPSGTSWLETHLYVRSQACEQRKIPGKQNV